ncbi:hypothetical protein ABPG75_013400 [Micractinium tetrahymenae]
MAAPAPCWTALPGPLLDCVFSHLDSDDLASCCAACKSWRALLCGAGSSGAPWAAALHQEYGHALHMHDHRAATRSMLIAARTSSRLFLAGTNFLGGAASGLQGGRFASPEQLVLLPALAGTAGSQAAADNPSSSSSDSAPSSGKSGASLAAGTVIPRSRGLGGAVSIKSIAAGSDFAVLLTWDGRVLDTRCLGPAPPANGRGGLDWRGLFQPPCCRAVAVAAGGCWQGSGRPGGHVLVVTDQHTVWGWGGNTAGQLGLAGCSLAGNQSAGAHGVAAEAGPAGGGPPLPAVPDWVAAPLEVVDSALAPSLGMPLAAACGEEHSLLLGRDGSLHAAGSNTAGACGLPLVQLASAAFAAVPLPAGEAGAAIACGGRNSAVVTARGRLMVCGRNELGQAGVGRAGSAVFLLRDIGPSADWHGMQRHNQNSSGGGGEAAAGAAGVAVGCGSLYALTDSGEAFSWGQGGQGELALGGNARNVASPSRMPWAHGAAQLAASCSGRFGALLDCHGRLFTFGAGKSGALGHGDTAKRAVGRQVKALAGYAVHAVACGADWMLVTAGWRPPAGRAGRGGGSPKAGAAPLDRQGAGSGPSSPSFQATPNSGFAYREVEAEPPSPRSPRQHSGREGQKAGHGGGGNSAGLLPGGMPSTPRSSHGGGAGRASEASSSSCGSRLRGRSGREQRREWEADEEAGARGGRGGRRGRGGGGGGLPALPDAAPEAAGARRQRWMKEPPTIPSPLTPPDMDSGPEEEGGGGRRGGGGMLRGVDRQMAYLMRRQLKAFSADPRQRVLVLPKSLSSRDRWKAHIMAESWGLMHESRGEGGRRRLVVWKPSRGCKTLKPGMLEGWSSSSSSDIEADPAGDVVGEGDPGSSGATADQGHGAAATLAGSAAP